MIYIPSSFPHGKSNQLPQYATKRDGVKSSHLIVSCLVDLIEVTPKAFILENECPWLWRSKGKKKSKDLACPTKRCDIIHKVEEGHKIL